MTVGERIRAERKKKDWTQKQLEDKTGINEANIRKYESGRQNPKAETLQKIASALDVTPAYLMGWEVHDFEKKGLTITDEEGNFITGEAAKTMLEAAENAKNALGINTKELINSSVDLGEVALEHIKRINKAYVKLNETGQKVAAERVEELAAIPKYTDKK